MKLVGRETSGNLAESSEFHATLGIFYMPKIYDMEQTALLPLRRKSCWGIFRPEKSDGFGTQPLDHLSRCDCLLYYIATYRLSFVLQYCYFFNRFYLFLYAFLAPIKVKKPLKLPRCFVYECGCICTCLCATHLKFWTSSPMFTKLGIIFWTT
jgi:hypothetical protein